jgi:alkylhydroperoxidase family enzyme
VRSWRHALPQLIAVGAGAATRTEPLRVFTALGRHPALFLPWLRFAGRLLRGELPAADRELVILRTAWRCGAPYEWVHHVPFAQRAGLGRPLLAAIAAGPESPAFGARQRLLLVATDELLDRRVISDHTWRALQERWTEQQLIELCLLVGHYAMLAMALNSLGVDPEPRARRRLDASLGDAADRLTSTLARRRQRASTGPGRTGPSRIAVDPCTTTTDGPTSPSSA